ncbi:hypothetical protein TVAG_303400 [Trichomonas vaginalis G3]|uniref:Uncharacterized protein n=1 Tax=Trichomonas vaginalis (strain ATCC PRA-98 / G3) TaxID=412133 RepID=A2DR22_TRIV3|nr:hypothetical protein TVAGG3_0694620 [Trichomonas vaginalis G3]EAY17121.1 hypothetical protein TVAG_303400 [Trichomonas vaginalis G3]KAI5508831.1 hypothetical protein TVAGG3_0694620 [Trichomonas vaginalis G3]|eukprot:XP_001329344.1 hypothetical protein [Trichomonas vaginalis G3]
MIFLPLLVSRVFCEEQNTENSESDPKRIEAILEIINTSPDKCPYNLNTSLISYCHRLDHTSRKNLAIQMMLCKLAKDNRKPGKPYRNNDDQFLSQLSDADFDTFTKFYLQIDKLCYESLHLSQYNQIEQILNNTLNAINFSSEFLSIFSSKMTNQTLKSAEALKQIEKTVFESTALSHTVLDTLKNSWGNVTYILQLERQYHYHIMSAKLYFKVNLVAFLLSFIIPNVFSPILSVSILMAIIEFHLVGIEMQFLISYLKKFYLLLCVLIIFSSLRLRIVAIKHRMIDPFLKNPKPKRYIR